jgi:hypothetical protein
LELALEYSVVVTTNSVIDLFVLSIPSDWSEEARVAVGVVAVGGSRDLFAWY